MHSVLISVLCRIRIYARRCVNSKACEFYVRSVCVCVNECVSEGVCASMARECKPRQLRQER